MAGELPGSVDARAASWLDAVGELLHAPMTTFPVETVMSVFADTFDVDAVAFGWTGADGEVEFRVTPRGSTAHLARGLHEQPLVWCEHPFTCWYFRSGSLRPQTLDRVPLEFAAGRATVKEFMRPIGCDHQLAVPLGPSRTYYTVTVGRADRDFTDADLEVACRAQAVLRGLRTQVEALHLAARRWPPRLDDDAAAAGLTARELAVLALVAEGLTATAVGRRLAISPRTVHKHLEHAYRKLGVTDRVTAVRVLGADRPPRSSVRAEHDASR